MFTDQEAIDNKQWTERLVISHLAAYCLESETFYRKDETSIGLGLSLTMKTVDAQYVTSCPLSIE